MISSFEKICLLEKVNHGTVAKFFDKSLKLLWSDEVKRENALLFVTDAVPYKVKTVRSLKLLNENMKNFTFLARALLRVAKEVRKYVLPCNGRFYFKHEKSIYKNSIPNTYF